MAYQDYAAIATYIRPWKQILMFFARTRKAEDRRIAPRYRFNEVQKRAWRTVLHVAQERVGEVAGGHGDRGAQKTHSKRRRQRNNDEEESEQEGAGESWQQDGEEEAKELTDIQRACLAFCIAFLDQRHIHHDYDSAMVCALAVLGVKSPGWKGVDQYPPILSKVIKIARFMVVQQAFEKVQRPAELGDVGYESDKEDYGGNEHPNGPVGDVEDVDIASQPDSAIAAEPPVSERGVIEAVRQMMDRFMVRGTAGPMQVQHLPLELQTQAW